MANRHHPENDRPESDSIAAVIRRNAN